MAGNQARDRIRRARRIEPYGAFRLAQRRQRAQEVGRLANVGECFEAIAYLVGELAAIDEQSRPPLVRNDGEGARQRRVRDIGAPHVEGPGRRMRIGNHDGVGAQLVFGALAGEAHIVQRHRAERRRRPVAPDRIDQVGLDSDQRHARAGGGFAEPFRVFHRVQPGIVAEAVAAREILLDPTVGRSVDEMLDGEQCRVDLLLRLQCIAAIDEQHRAIHQHEGGAG